MKKIVLIGDSITFSFPADDLLKEFHALNKGIPGDTTLGVLDRLDQDVFIHKPDTIFLMIGTNDLALGRSNEEILQSYRSIAYRLKQGSGTSDICLISILPVRIIDNRPNSRIAELNEGIKEIAGELKLRYFDLHSHFIDADGELKSIYTDDGLHLTYAAYLKWAEMLKGITGLTGAV